MKEEENRKTGQTDTKQQDSGLEITKEDISVCHVPVKQAAASVLVKMLL